MIQTYLFEEVADGQYAQRDRVRRNIDAALLGGTDADEPALND